MDKVLRGLTPDLPPYNSVHLPVGACCDGEEPNTDPLRVSARQLYAAGGVLLLLTLICCFYIATLVMTHDVRELMRSFPFVCWSFHYCDSRHIEFTIEFLDKVSKNGLEAET